MSQGAPASSVSAATRRGGAGRVVLGGCLLSLLTVAGMLVVGLVFLFGDPCMPFCVSADSGTWGTLAATIAAGAGFAYIVLLVRLVRRRRAAWVVSSTLGWGVLVIVLATGAMIGADAVTAEPRFCSC